MKKKVKDCTITELEKWYTKKEGYIPDYISVYWYDVRFYSIDSNILISLMKDEEIEIN